MPPLISYALVGSPIEHSPSPAMHNAAFETLQMNAGYKLRPADTDAAELIIAELRHGKWAGINVTTPLKTTLASYVVLEGHAARAKAVNTLWRYGSEVHGALTDVDGIKGPLAEEGFKQGQQALIIGGGGAARAAAIALDEFGATVHVATRNPAKATEFLAEMEVQSPGEAVGLSNQEALKELLGQCDAIIQATPVGTNNEEHPLNWESVKPECIAFEMVYRPIQTPFLAKAASAGCKTIEGWRMLLAQGAAAQKIWTGRDAPVEEMQHALKSALGVN